MKKLFRFDTVLLLIVFLFCIASFYEAYRIATIFTVEDPEVAYTYETILYGVPIMLVLSYFIVYARFSSPYDAFSRTIRYSFFTIMFALISSSYYLGLNMNWIITKDEDAFQYQLGLPVFWMMLLLLTGAFINSLIIYKYTTFRSKKTPIVLSQVIMGLVYGIIFITFVTDSVALLGLFDL